MSRFDMVGRHWFVCLCGSVYFTNIFIYFILTLHTSVVLLFSLYTELLYSVSGPKFLLIILKPVTVKSNNGCCQSEDYFAHNRCWAYKLWMLWMIHINIIMGAANGSKSPRACSDDVNQSRQLLHLWIFDVLQTLRKWKHILIKYLIFLQCIVSLSSKCCFECYFIYTQP